MILLDGNFAVGVGVERITPRYTQWNLGSRI
jgi:hypothetical protein